MFGTDPEYFAVVTNDGKQYVVSPALLYRFMGVPIIDPDKEHKGKHPVFFENDKIRAFMDGVAFELNTKRPYSSISEMMKDIKDGVDFLRESLYPYRHSPWGELEVYTKPVVNMDNGMYSEYLDDYFILQGYEFGCDPDFDAVDPEYVCKTVDVFSHPYRYGGGHLHVSNNKFYEYLIPTIQLMAITVGNYCISKSPYPELEVIRGSQYGRPGRYRPQVYSEKNNIRGIEYRSPSNSWTSLPLECGDEMEYLVNVVESLIDNPEKGKEIIEAFLSNTVLAMKTADQTKSANIVKEVANV